MSNRFRRGRLLPARPSTEDACAHRGTRMGMEARENAIEKPETIKTLGEVGSDAERALTDLGGALTAVRAIVSLTLADGSAEEGPVLYKRLNALEYLLRQAGYAEDVLWVTVDQMSTALDEHTPAPFSS